MVVGKKKGGELGSAKTRGWKASQAGEREKTRAGGAKDISETK